MSRFKRWIERYQFYYLIMMLMVADRKKRQL